VASLIALNAETATDAEVRKRGIVKTCGCDAMSRM